MPKKSKKNKEPKITYYEAMLGYKISLKEKELEDTNFALKELIEKNDNFKQRNERLKDTKEVYLKKALNDYKNLNNETDKQDKCVKEDVLNEMKNLWNSQKQLEDELIDIKIQIKQTENSISQTKKEIRMWNEYKNKGHEELNLHKKLLNEEMDAMKESFEKMSDHFINELKIAREYISLTTEQTVEKEHKSAADKIFKEMDKYTVQMMHDNKWMAEKVKLYKEEVNQLNEETSKLEKENIELMTRLFDCGVKDLRVIKDALQFQFLDDENIEQNTILDIDLDKLDSIRPKSGLDRAVEKVMKVTINDSRTSEDDDNETFLTQTVPSYVNLGPYEYRALNLQGLKKPIYNTKTQTIEEIKANDFKCDENDWPVTQDMLKVKINS